MQLTRNFSLEEFRCPCPKCVGKTSGTLITMQLVQGLQQIRELVKKPLTILSGYRCPSHNNDGQVGGANHSKHTTGEAADITSSLPLLKLYEAALQVDVFKRGGIGLYPQNNFIHVDVCRPAPARWARIDNLYVGIDRGLALLTPKTGKKV